MSGFGFGQRIGLVARRNFPLLLGNSGATEPSTLQTSATMGSVEFFFHDDENYLIGNPVQVKVGQFANGRPFAVSDRLFWVSRITPDGTVVTVSAGAWMKNSVAYPPAPMDLPVNGVMDRPFFGPGGTSAQGFSGFWAEYGDGNLPGSESAMPYSPALDLDPVANGNVGVQVNIGDERCLVKGVHLTGLNALTGTWGIWEELACLYLLPTEPPLGAYAPPVFEQDFANYDYRTRSQRNLSCLPGFATSTGMPSMATVQARASGDSYVQPLMPFFGLGGEKQRRLMIDRSGAIANGYQGGPDAWGVKWNEHFAAILASGPSIADADIDNSAQFGIDIFGEYDRGFKHSAGAGQYNGYKQFAALAMFLFHAQDATLQDKLKDIRVNGTHLRFYPQSGWEGFGVYYPSSSGKHYRNRLPPRPGDILDPAWWTRDGFGTYPPASPYELMDWGNMADYLLVSCPAEFLEILNIMLLLHGPGDWDGSQVLADSASDFTSANWRSACINFNDMYRHWQAGSGTLTQPRLTAHQQYYDDHRDDAVAPRYVTVPGVFVPVGSETTWLQATADGFTYDWRSIDHNTDPGGILEYQTRYALYQSDAKAGLSWIVLADTTGQGTVTGCTGQIPLAVQYRRRNSIGWSEWSYNFPLMGPGGAYTSDRFLVTPTGAASGTPANTLAPSINVKEFEDWNGPFYKAAPPNLDLDTDPYDMYPAWGYWSGDISGGPNITWSNAATAVPYSLDATDLSTALDFDLDFGGSAITSGVVNIPARPVQPTGLIFKGDFHTRKAALLYPGSIASANSGGSSNVTPTLEPGAVVNDSAGDPLAEGLWVGYKTSNFPRLGFNAAADFPLTVGVTYRAIVHVVTDAVDAWNADGRFKAGITADSITYKDVNGSPITNAASPQLVVIEDSPGLGFIEFTATSANLFLSSIVKSSSAGTSAGGSPVFAKAEVYRPDQYTPT